MAHDVTVALVGSTEYYERFPQGERTRPYGDRPKVTLAVEDEEVMERVIRRARPALGIDDSMSLGHIGFYRPEDEDGLKGYMSDTVTLVDEQGHAVWGNWWAEVPFREILRSGNAGVLGGDPLRPYTGLKAPIGNGMLPDWEQIHAFLEIARNVIQVTSEVGGVAAFFELMRRRLSKAPETLERNASQWTERGGSPARVAEWLDRRPWHLDDVAAALACSLEEAEAVLWAFGFAQSEDGLFRRSDDEAATALSENMKAAISGRIHTLTEREMESLVRQTAEQIRREGRVAETDESGWPWYS